MGDFNPNQANQIWKKILVLIGDLDDREVAEALNAAGVPISRSRVAAWSRREGHKNYSPLNVAELEQALDALIQYDQNRDA